MSGFFRGFLPLILLTAACSGPERRRAECLKTFSIMDLPVSASWPIYERTLHEGGGAPTAYFLYHSCLAIAEGDLSRCALLPPVVMGADGKTLPRICREDFLSVSAAKAFILRSPDALSLCERAASEDDVHREQGSGAAICSAVVANLDRPEQAAAAAASFSIGGSTASARELSLGLRRQLGDPAACRETSEPEEKHNCEHFAAFKLAAQAKDPSLCADKTYCLLMMGAGSEVCAPLASAVAQQWCALSAPLAAGGGLR